MVRATADFFVSSGLEDAGDKAMGDALAATGRKIPYSLCEWGVNDPWLGPRRRHRPAARRELAWQSAENGRGPAERDTGVGNQGAGDGRTMSIGGVTYDKGLGSHAPADVEYYLGGDCSTVQADVGVDDEVTKNSALTFEIWADGRNVADSGLMTFSDPAEPLTPDVSGAQEMHLVVTDDDGTDNSDHADWGDARITCA